MKWPFVRRKTYDKLRDDYNDIHQAYNELANSGKLREGRLRFYKAESERRKLNYIVLKSLYNESEAKRNKMHVELLTNKLKG